MNLDELKQKLRKYKKEDITVSHHANIQALARDVDIEKMKENIINPEKLVYDEKQEAKHPSEEKYNCYFALSSHHYHRYIIVLNRKIIISTIIDVNRDWQKAIG